MNVGTLKENWNEARTGIDSITGRIVTYSMNLPIRLEPLLSQRTESSPTHAVIGKGTHGQPFQAGLAWQNTDKNGKKYFSILIDVPELFEKPMNYVAFDNKEGGFDIQVSREKPAAQPTEQKQAA